VPIYSNSPARDPNATMPLSTKFPARSVAVGGEISASVGKRQLIVLLISAAATEFLFVAIAAYVAAIVYHRLILTSSVDPAKYIPEALLIATLDLLVSIGHRQYSRIQLVLPRLLQWRAGMHGGFHRDETSIHSPAHRHHDMGQIRNQ
jgi:hypothetical protein